MAKIMLVEDDNNLREIYAARLQAEGHEIVAARDGEEALALAVKEKPELIISDVMMPRISGFDMLDILRNAPETKNTKVIMMTALSQAEDKLRANKLGADRYLVKSQVTLEDVVNVVKNVLEGIPESDSAPAADTLADKISSIIDKTTTTDTSTQPAVVVIANPVPEITNDAVSSQVVAPPTEPTEIPPTTAVTPPVDITTTTPEPATIEPPAETTPVVELPQMPDTSTPTPVVPVVDNTQDNSTVSSSSDDIIGPNLAEALASEEENTQTSTASQPFEASPQVASDNNGIPSTAPIEPSPPAEEKPDAPDLHSQDTGVSTEGSGAVAGMRVVQPISDPNAQPDINELLAAEERKAAVENPTANSIITPGQLPNTPSQKPQNDQLNNIAL